MSQLNVDTIKKAAGTGTLSVPAETGTVVTTASPSLGRRNLIINGAMQVAQRGTSESISASSTLFPVDRMEFGFGSHAQLAGTVSQSTTAPNGFSNSVKLDVTTAETALDSGEGLTFRQKFEGQNVQQLAKGTTDAKQVTLSFWVRSSQTGTYVAELYDQDNTRQISKSYTVDTTDTWEHKTITFPADTTGALDNDNNLSLWVLWWLAAGTDFTSGTLNDDAWAAVTNGDRAAGQTNVIGSVNDWYITGVQLEVGSVATPFEHRSYCEELALCERYYIRYVNEVTGYASTIGSGTYYTSTQFYCVLHFPTTMRTNPSFSDSSGTDHFRIYAGNQGADNFNSWNGLQQRGTKSYTIYVSSGVSGTTGWGGWAEIVSDDAYLEFDSEL